jgi:histidine triad (HIT) family protein
MRDDEILLRDSDVVVLLPRKAIAEGHIIVAPVEEYKVLEQVPRPLLSKMFQIANKFSSVLFDTLHCQGTNILVQNGVAAGQINPRFSVSVIPRYEEDGLGLEWTPKQAEAEKLDEALVKFSDLDSEDGAARALEGQKKKAEEKKEANIIRDDKKKGKSYLLRSLDRVA